MDGWMGKTLMSWGDGRDQDWSWEMGGWAFSFSCFLFVFKGGGSYTRIHHERSLFLNSLEDESRFCRRSWMSSWLSFPGTEKV